MNHKRVERLWRREGMQVPGKKRKKRRLGNSSGGCIRRRSKAMNDVWSYDFVFDRTEDGRPIRILTLIDEYTRECLAIHTVRGIKSTNVIDVLMGIMAERGCPNFIRSDNGPEFVARALRKWLNKEQSVKTLYIEPGSPWQDGSNESFNGKLRDELLACELFCSIEEARWLIEEYLKEYNSFRPHGGLGGLTSDSFAAECRGQVNNPGRKG